ncbi:MAG: DNA-directed RNA polymerase subunit omega [Actinobacteria bacterium 21-64-8]|nr:MAG: DNA-directed RNA polymerase subunit omega [Actinobacteria bacterium 21-64-8]
MAERPTLVDPPIETLLHKVGDSKFTLVAVTAIRAREINEYYNGLGSGHGALIPPQVSSVSNKSLSLAMEELYEGKLQFHRPTAEELEAERLQTVAQEEARLEETSDLDAFTDALRDA